MSHSNTIVSVSVALILFSLIIESQSVVPPSQRFQYINFGPSDIFKFEYGADYRVLGLATPPFSLCFYNSTPDVYILGLGMGLWSDVQSPPFLRWVWDANRGSPVRLNAKVTFGADGNLVLTDVDGKVAWQSGTANKGVVGISLLPNGNLVLYDGNGKFVWQSFDHPTDTLLVGQALKAAGPTRLVSRLSASKPVNGHFSFVMEKRAWAMYYQSKNSQKPLVYYRSIALGNDNQTLQTLGCYTAPQNDENYVFELGLNYTTSSPTNFGVYIFNRVKYNTTYSMLRLGVDGNLRVYTYDMRVSSWEISFRYFNRDEGWTDECPLPRRCGSLGVCEDSQCVACPTPQGLMGWNSTCAPPPLPPCKGGANVDYYKVDGVDHYTSAYDEGNGPVSLGQCKDQCNKDCKCLGFFYRQESSKCLTVADLGTFVKVPNSNHTGYVKISK